MADYDLDAALVASEQARGDKQQTLEDYRSRLQADDRSRIAKIIVWAFVILMGWVVLAATVGAALFDWNDLTEPAKYLMAILSSVMLPVVTLVIGYYFGKEK